MKVSTDELSQMNEPNQLEETKTTTKPVLLPLIPLILSVEAEAAVALDGGADEGGQLKARLLALRRRPTVPDQIARLRRTAPQAHLSR